MFEKSRQLIEQRFYISSKGFRMMFIGSVLMMLAALAIVWPNVRKVKLSYDYQALADEREELLTENHLLRLEKESLQSLYRIQELAKNEVGMIEPEKSQIILFLNSNFFDIEIIPITTASIPIPKAKLYPFPESCLAKPRIDALKTQIREDSTTFNSSPSSPGI